MHPTITIPCEGKTREQFYALSAETLKQLEWKINDVNDEMISFEVSQDSKGSLVLHKNADEAILSVESMPDTESADAEIFYVTYKNILGNYTDEQLESIYQEMVSEFGFGENEAEIRPTAWKKLESIFGIFIPTDDYFITPIIINLNLLIFIIMALSGVSIIDPTTEELVAWGANFGPLTLDGQIWRLLTSTFLHVGVLHLLMNCYALLYIGVLLEPFLGKLRFSAAYVLSGIVASAASLWWDNFRVSAGASGAIFGMYGVFLALLTGKLIEKEERNRLLGSIGIFVFLNLAYGMKAGIDNMAHAGGLISGVLIGFSMMPDIQKNRNGHAALGIISACMVLVVFLLFARSSRDIIVYKETMEKFGKNEEIALGVYALSDASSNEDYVTEIDRNGIPKWTENIKLLVSLEKLKLPEDIDLRNFQLMQYCRLRIESYNLIKEKLSHPENQAIDSALMAKNTEIEQTLRYLQ